MYKNVKVNHKGQRLAKAKCLDCRWVTAFQKVAEDANKHCKETGHTVSVEKKIVYELTPKQNYEEA